MPLSKKDHLGRRGEKIAFVRLTEVCQANDLPYFVPHFLGDKCPLFDALVELVGTGGKTPYFFAQVKATRAGVNSKGRLKVEVKKSDVIDIVHFPAPTYVIGIDERKERAYIVAVYGGMNKKISSLNTAHELTPTTLKHLWDEVSDYWKDKDMRQKSSRFTN
ncbi:MAG: hypothetical protein L0Z62_29930 [Gemmataceae bacterium]|nr:hypothetical protein [Gemmataceae bacterium]